MRPSTAAFALTSLAGLQVVAGNPLTAAALGALAVCLAAWAFGGLLGRLMASHAEATYRE